MDIMEFLKTRRTYRRFEQKPVEPAIAREIMEAARIASCGANRQTLKYVLVQSPEMVAKMQPLVHWAAYLPPGRASPNRIEPRYCLWLSARMKACPVAMIPIPDLPLPT